MDTKGRLILLTFLGVILAASSFALLTGGRPDSTDENMAQMVALYKSPTCGCCDAYGKYLENIGYRVEVRNTLDISSVKADLGVPHELESCHTIKIADYIVEGHVPHEAIRKLLTERPDIKGIGMAGMPSGSPGMPGPQTEDFVIYTITHDGARGNVFLTL